MSEKHPGPLVVEGKLTDAERMKLESNYLRGTIAEDLNDGLTGGFKGDNFLLIRFHGYIPWKRISRKLSPLKPPVRPSFRSSAMVPRR